MTSGHKITLVVACFSTTLLMLVLWVMVYAARADGNAGLQPDKALMKVDLKCHPEASYQNGQWADDGWSGWYSTCVQAHGPFLVYRDGHLAIRGRYVNGQRDGEFVFYAADGSVTKRVRFSNGKEVRE